ncbi:Isoprene synthase, chloroplastic, partial [Mucuna pruriens]
MFKGFRDEKENFKVEISNDVQGMLSLYAASYLTFEGESLWEANTFSRTYLMNLLKQGIDVDVAKQVWQVLEGLPYHQSFHRLEARRYIDTYAKKGPHNHLMLELAKLDFNIIQSLHQKELQEVSRWWKDFGLASKIHFARDRIVESFFWSLGMIPQPQITKSRKELTKVGILITIIDDIYDVYGTLEELELFTNAIERWDVNAINTLPDYMILCFLALYNTVNEMAYDIFKEQGVKSIHYLKKSWSDLCKSYLQEAKWFHNKVTPSFDEFLENGWISSGGGPLLIHSYFLVTHDQDITEQALHSLTNYHDPLRSAMTILRLTNDLGTSTDEIERGETSNSIISYLHETGLSKENARQYYTTLIDKEWQNLNKYHYQVMHSIFSKSFIHCVLNFARIAQYTYQYGDGYGRQDDISINRIKLLLVDPIPVNIVT